MAERGVGVSPGGYLRALREARGISIEEMARATKVGVHQLDALESDRIAELPPPVFVRGFLRACCQALGEAPDEALRRYGLLLWEVPPPPRAVPARSASAAAPIAVSFALLVVLGLGLLAVNVFLRSEGRLDAPAPAPRSVGATKASSRLLEMDGQAVPSLGARGAVVGPPELPGAPARP